MIKLNFSPGAGRVLDVTVRRALKTILAKLSPGFVAGTILHSLIYKKNVIASATNPSI